MSGRRHLRHILLRLLAMAVVASAASAAPAQATTLYGVHQDLTMDGHASSREQGIDIATRLGAEVSRSSFLWSQIEPVQGTRDWSRYDAVLDELDAAGLEPEFTVYGSPAWANGADPTSADATVQVPPGTGTAFRAWVARYAEFMRQAVRRYHTRVHLWELGNEENEPWFWRPAPDIDQYTIWYEALRSAILDEDPTARIAVGGLAGLAAGCCITGTSFLQGLLDRGVAPDVVAIHPYTSNGHAPDVHEAWQDNFDDIGMIHDQLRARGIDAELWITEWGWSSAQVGVQNQARYIRTSLEMIRDRYPFVSLAIAFVDRDRPTYAQGMFTESLQPKPAAAAYESFMATLRDGGPSSADPQRSPTGPASPSDAPRPTGTAGRTVGRRTSLRTRARRGVVRVRVRCARTDRSCVAQLEVTRAGRHGRSLARRVTTVRAGRSRLVRLRLSATRRHRSARKIPVVVTVGGTGPVSVARP
jgi:hypothetical protein